MLDSLHLNSKKGHEVVSSYNTYLFQDHAIAKEHMSIGSFSHSTFFAMEKTQNQKALDVLNNENKVSSAHTNYIPKEPKNPKTKEACTMLSLDEEDTR